MHGSYLDPFEDASGKGRRRKGSGRQQIRRAWVSMVPIRVAGLPRLRYRHRNTAVTSSERRGEGGEQCRTSTARRFLQPQQGQAVTTAVILTAWKSQAVRTAAIVTA